MLELYCAPTPNAQRARLALEETGVPYLARPVDLLIGEQHSARFRALNPLQAVPVLVDPDGPDGRPLVLSQSIAIMWYVAEKYCVLIPASRGRRLAMIEWLMLSGADIAGTNSAANHLVRAAPGGAPDEVKLLRLRLLKYFSACDTHLQGHEYFADELSLADLSLFPFYVARRELLGDELPHLHAWARRIEERPPVRRGMSG